MRYSERQRKKLEVQQALRKKGRTLPAGWKNSILKVSDALTDLHSVLALCRVETVGDVPVRVHVDPPYIDKGDVRRRRERPNYFPEAMLRVDTPGARDSEHQHINLQFTPSLLDWLQIHKKNNGTNRAFRTAVRKWLKG